MTLFAGGYIPKDASREPDVVHGRVYEAAATGHRDQLQQGHDALHAHPPAQGQDQHEQDDHHRPADLPGHGLPARQGHRAQGPQEQEYLLGERESRYS